MKEVAFTRMIIYDFRSTYSPQHFSSVYLSCHHSILHWFYHLSCSRSASSSVSNELWCVYTPYYV